MLRRLTSRYSAISSIPIADSRRALRILSAVSHWGTGEASGWVLMRQLSHKLIRVRKTLRATTCAAASQHAINFPMGNPDLIGTAEAAEILGVSRQTVHRWAGEPKLKSIKMPGETSPFLFERADVERLRDELAAEQSA